MLSLISLFHIFIFIDCVKIVQNSSELFSAYDHRLQKVKALIRRRAECAAFDQSLLFLFLLVFQDDITYVMCEINLANQLYTVACVLKPKTLTVLVLSKLKK